MQVTSDIRHFADYLRSINCLSEIHQKSLGGYLPDSRAFHMRSIMEKSGLSSSQIKYICELKPRKAMLAIKGSFCQFTFVIGPSDSKDIFISTDFQLIYDAKPQWLPSYIDTIRALVSRLSLENNRLQYCCVPGGLLSFSHFVGRNLGPLIIFGKSLCLPYVLPISRGWQRSLIDVYCPEISTICLDRSSQIGDNIFFTTFDSSWLFEELFDWETLLVARGQLPSIAPKLEGALSETTSVEGCEKIFLSRLRYEVLYAKSPRTINWPDIARVLTERSFSMVFPETLSISEVLHKIYHSNLIVCEAGSAFINYVLFASSLTRIIQLSPRNVLQKGDSFSLLSPIQWYMPVIDQITFLPSIRNGSSLHKGNFSWNEASRYDVMKLLDLLRSME